MSQPTIGAGIKLTGEKEFKQALSEINAGLRVNKSEMELLAAQYSKSGGSVEALTAKGNALESQINSQTEKVRTLESALQSSASKYGESSTKTMEWQASLNKAKSELVKLTDASEENKKAMEKAKKTVGEYDEELDETTQGTSKFGSLSSKIFSKLGIDVKDSEQSASKSLMDYVSQLSTTGDKSGEISDIIGGALGGAPVVGALAAATAILKIASAAQDAANEVEQSTARMQVALGFTDEEAQVAALSVDNIYKKGIAENESEAEKALVAVMKLMKSQGEEAEDLSNQIIALSKAHGEDVTTTARTASTLMHQFGIDGQQALDLIAAGLQTTANKNNDLLDVLNEYSSSFERIGYSAEEFLTMIVSATDAGAYSADKSADIVKEFYNKAASGSQDFADGLKQLGLNSQQTINQLTSGGDTAQITFEKVAKKLAGVTSESTQAQIASKLFGSQWEDVGTKATLALTSTKQELISTTGKAQEAVSTLSKTTIATNAQFGREWLSDIKKALGFFGEASAGAGQKAGANAAEGFEGAWVSGEKEILKTVQGTTDSANKILSSIGSNENGGNSSKTKTIPAYALGTSYHTGGFARINDRPNDPNSGEIIDLPTGSRVYPAGTHPAGGGDTFNITIDAKNVQEFNDIVRMAKNARQQRRAR